jgi:hypothetical protein
MLILRPSRIAILTFTLALSLAAEEELLVINAPSVTVPLEGTGRVLKYDRQFSVSRRIAEQVYENIAYGRKRPIDAVKAIEAAKASVFVGDSEVPLQVTKLELLKVEIGPHEKLEYFMITVRVTGTEEHRVVLLDGTILKPKIKQAPPDTK